MDEYNKINAIIHKWPAFLIIMSSRNVRDRGLTLYRNLLGNGKELPGVNDRRCKIICMEPFTGSSMMYLKVREYESSFGTFNSKYLRFNIATFLL